MVIKSFYRGVQHILKGLKGQAVRASGDPQSRGTRPIDYSKCV